VSRIDSYDREATRPLVGTRWVWEPERAPTLIKVTTVRWNGEEWWIGTRTLAEEDLPESMQTIGTEMWNDLSRFWEACHHVSLNAGPPSSGGVTRAGEPKPAELAQAVSVPGQTDTESA
jgi:hypothetical protein